ncbi:MAG: hypothetical protein QUS07_07355 [Methanothrix sp.]|nr:hypothetical protein [Methanothrix sp.]
MPSIIDEDTFPVLKGLTEDTIKGIDHIRFVSYPYRDDYTHFRFIVMRDLPGRQIETLRFCTRS